MRIALLCSSLEPGKDGVGDYSTLLAKECVRQGHPVALVALNDRHLRQTVEGEVPIENISGEIAIPCLRMPSDMDWAERVGKAVPFLQKFAPDWLSLQFVCYGFQYKGIVANQVRHLGVLAQAVKPAKTQLMLHELWIGDTPQWPIRQRLVGVVQQHFILALLRAWSPAVIHTSNEGYQRRMAAVGFDDVKLLPLFSNIPVGKSSGEAWLLPRLQEQNVTTSARTDYLLCGLFGSLPPQWKPEPLFSYLLDASQQMKRKPVLLSAGRMSEKGQILWNQIQSRYGNRMILLNFGELPSGQVSEYLNTLDIGIAGTDVRKIGKSSTTATMLDHGLPVLINQNDGSLLKPWDVRSQTLLHVVDNKLPECIVSGLPRLPSASGLSDISAMFLESLKYCSSN